MKFSHLLNFILTYTIFRFIQYKRSQRFNINENFDVFIKKFDINKNVFLYN